jgi:hypothetical protein
MRLALIVLVFTSGCVTGMPRMRPGSDMSLPPSATVQAVDIVRAIAGCDTERSIAPRPVAAKEKSECVLRPDTAQKPSGRPEPKKP